ncbi:ExbD/TolR family protein [Paludibacterium purpuratum]|uniref:Outer membrane transport energization protein ExbD n=1 Tax=Paludibacterium purpuratum TaxID=1144873 RepID=A0A4R7AWM6_9NEIS|nr:biopolymer transporter ExbD [Paludibacterium purpuratum]TDR71424.1 outer membrane transport energization protein ExbD [Paludibacterium purpuratum]
MYFLDEEPRKKARIEIIPMIDVMMFLLVFFVLISLNVIPATGLPTQLPTSRNAAQQTPNKPVIVTLTANGTLQLNGRDVAASVLPAELKALQQPGNPLSVIVKSDGAAQVQRMVDVMDLIRDSGINQISIAAKKKA